MTAKKPAKKKSMAKKSSTKLPAKKPPMKRPTKKPAKKKSKIVDLKTRRTALAEALEGFPVAHDKVLEVHGVRLPKHFAYAIGWWQGLSDYERRKYRHLFGEKPIGIGAWMCTGRFDTDPPLAREAKDPQ